jgi:carotenoid cleavage dioxygenase
VQGAIPPELRGVYLRNGPNPKTGRSAHWFLGDGMLHGVCLEDGQARWYRNRWVRTRPFVEGDENAPLVRPDGTVDRTSAKANTHVIRHAGRILALVESSFPTELTRELDTVGPHDFGGKLTTAMTAHPKLCPLTGEMHFFGYGFSPPYLTYHRADARGELVQSEEIAVPGATMIHDFAITERNVIFMDLPVVFDAQRATQGTMPYAWSDTYGARLGVMPRGGSNADVRWFEIAPCYVFHPMNAFDDGDAVVLDVARYPHMFRAHASEFASANLYRFRIDLAAGRVREQKLDDRALDFPRVDPRREGRSYRHGYAVRFSESPDGPRFGSLLHFDHESGAVRTHDFGPGSVPGEAVFVPASPGAGENEGYALVLVYDEASGTSRLEILDASAFGKPPLATVALPQRVPFGFHGSWLGDPA